MATPNLRLNTTSIACSALRILQRVGTPKSHGGGRHASWAMKRPYVSQHVEGFWSPAIKFLLFCVAVSLLSGCSFVPDARKRARYHNPLPQLHKIAVLPFFNQSSEATLDQIAVAEAYYAELQAIPGFEVVPVGVTVTQVEAYAYQTGAVDSAGDIVWEQIDPQLFAQTIGVDAVVMGSVTDFTPYSPPRLAMTTRWYAANPAFHPVPAGYGLPWGTKAEKTIPRHVLLETELELARAQMATQTPPVARSAPPTQAPHAMQQEAPPTASMDEILPPKMAPPLVPTEEVPTDQDWTEVPYDSFALAKANGALQPTDEVFFEDFSMEPVEWVHPMECAPLEPCGPTGPVGPSLAEVAPPTQPLPADWPDPSRLIPPSPNPQGAPNATPQYGPIMSHTRIYHGDDPDFTEKLADYVYAMDDGRQQDWRGYLMRSDDFIRFCCYLHITEMLELRGGRDKSDLIIRWPIGRYRR